MRYKICKRYFTMYYKVLLLHYVKHTVDNIFFFVLGDPTGVVCPPGMFKCPEGKCIPSLWVCNYQKDCEKGEDEFQQCSKYYF